MGRRLIADILVCYFEVKSLDLLEEKTNRRRVRFAVRLSAAFLASTLFIVVAFSTAGSRAASFTPLGDLDGGPFRSFARAVSDDGSTVVGASRVADFSDRAYIWTKANGIAPLADVPEGHFGDILDAYDISNDGSVIVGQGRVAGPGFTVEAYRWTQATGYVGLGDIPLGAFQSSATEVSADGSVVAGNGTGTGAGAPSQERAFRWVGNVMTDLGTISPVVSTTTRAISGDGQTVVGITSNNTGFRWTQGTGLVETLPGGSGGFTTAVPWSINHDGSVVVGNGQTATGNTGYRWTQAGGYVSIGDLDGGTVSSAATVVSADGSIVLGSSSATGGNRAFIWDAAHGIRNLTEVLVNEFGLGASLTNWILNDPTGISTNGKFIIGNGINPAGVIEGFLISLEPNATPLVGDYNGDETVNAADYTVWRDSFGQMGEDLPADGSGNDEIDAEDYDIWKAHFGEPGSGGGSALGVPEPATWMLAALAALAGFLAAVVDRRPQSGAIGVGFGRERSGTETSPTGGPICSARVLLTAIE